MRFSEAMKALEDGKKVICDSWETGNFLSLEELKSCYEMPFLAQDVFLKWYVYEDPPKTYSLWEILPALKEGKKIKRTCWENPAAPIHLEKAASGKWCPLFINENGYPMQLDLDEIEANDWMVIE